MQFGSGAPAPRSPHGSVPHTCSHPTLKREARGAVVGSVPLRQSGMVSSTNELFMEFLTLKLSNETWPLTRP